MRHAVLFGPRGDLLLRLSGVAFLGIGGAVAWVSWGAVFSSYGTSVGLYVPQTVPFSHAHHVAGLGIDCRYCHATAEYSSRAGMPTTDTCMHCHAQLWTNADVLAPVRESWRTGAPLRWQRVHKLPDFVYFDHSVHLAAGVGCSTCHGRIDQMPLVAQAETLHMRWCLDCHRHPEDHLRNRSDVYEMEWAPGPDQLVEGRRLLSQNQVRTANLTDCTACHR